MKIKRPDRLAKNPLVLGGLGASLVTIGTALSTGLGIGGGIATAGSSLLGGTAAALSALPGGAALATGVGAIGTGAATVGIFLGPILPAAAVAVGLVYSGKKIHEKINKG